MEDYEMKDNDVPDEEDESDSDGTGMQCSFLSVKTFALTNNQGYMEIEPRPTIFSVWIIIFKHNEITVFSGRGLLAVRKQKKVVFSLSSQNRHCITCRDNSFDIFLKRVPTAGRRKINQITAQLGKNLKNKQRFKGNPEYLIRV